MDCMKKERTLEEKKTLKSRINRIKGQMEGISKMIDEDRYCKDILIQLAAVESSIKSLSSIVFENHMKSCVKDSISKGDTSSVDEIICLFKKFI